MGRKETRYIQCAHFSEEKRDRNENVEGESSQPEVPAACTECILKQKLPRNVLKICYVCLVELIISE